MTEENKNFYDLSIKQFSVHNHLKLDTWQWPKPRCLKEGEREAAKAGRGSIQALRRFTCSSRLRSRKKAGEKEEQKEGGDGAAGDPKKEKKPLNSDENEDEEDDYQQKCKGTEGLMDIENPNQVAQTTKKVTQLDLELSRREDKIEKQ
ncbi:hypothetical protein P7K49_012385 [Saguinus oedipus]|uniref:Uncharacterized protein n=1 Tax=Saguinus oedipus TaxID=9490 RepID=A0ABQ9VTD0_SAGOE|nr:hypothetical protein P7K49_012385 [Saguinus oedipus]